MKTRTGGKNTRWITPVMALMLLFAMVSASGCANKAGPSQGEGPPGEPGSQTTAQTGDGASGESTGDEKQDTASGEPENSTDAEQNGAETAGAEDGFTADPEASGGEEGAAESILDVRFGQHEGYERAVIDFGAGNEAATGIPRWTLDSPTGEGNTRISLPGIRQTAISDGDFPGEIMDGFYVVRAPDGSLFIDILATGAFQYRVAELSDSGRLVIDYRPSTSELDFPLPARSERTVLMTPREGTEIESPIAVNGYSRNFEAQNTIRLVDSAGNVLAETTAQSSDWSETWGYFETSLETPPFEGEATLQVGTQSARDGSFDGVEIPVTYGG